MENKFVNIAIIGAGPAGISSAIQLKRFGKSPVLFEKKEIGGLVKNAHLIENYLGFPNGVNGINFSKLLKKQLQFHQVTTIREEVKKLDYYQDRFVLVTNKSKYFFPVVIIATGTEPIKPDIDPEGVRSQDSTAQVYFDVEPFLNTHKKQFAIVGAGDVSFDYAINLLQRNNKVYLLNRSQKPKAISKLVQSALSYENFYYIHKVKTASTAPQGNRIMLLYYTCQGLHKITVNFLIYAIGRKQSCSFFSALLKSRVKELVKKRKLFFAGDVAHVHQRQIAYAVGDGIRIATEIDHYI